MAATITKMTAIDKKKARADEANTLIEQLDEVTQKAIYIATNMFLAAKDMEEGMIAKK